jgi:hypothetical protein
MLSILAGINNYYFYSHVERSAERNAIQLHKQLKFSINELINDNVTIDQINNNVIGLVSAWKSKAYYNNKLIVIDVKNNVHNLYIDKKWDKVTTSNITIDINSYINKKPNAFKLSINFDTKFWLISIIRSMTFSISEIIEDITKVKKAEFSGTATTILKENKYDGLITINEKYKGYYNNTIKKIIIKSNDNNIPPKIYSVGYGDKVLIKNGDIVNKGDKLIEGTIVSGILRFQYSYWYRSRPVVGFTIFLVLLLWFFRKREENHKKELLQIDENNIKEANNTIENEVKLIENSDQVNDEYENLCERFKEYDKFINPPVNTVNVENIINQCYDMFGTQLRKAAEKIVYKLYEDKIGSLTNLESINLNNAVWALNKRGFISFEIKKKLDMVRDVGNRASHFNEKQISKTEAIVAANKLLDIIDDLNIKYEQNHTKQEDNNIIIDEDPAIKKKKTGLNIIKKANGSK